jgi:hypothetical protein
VTTLSIEPPGVRRLPSWRFAIVADRKQPILDREPNAFLD